MKSLVGAFITDARCELMLSMPVIGVKWSESGRSVELGQGRRLEAHAVVVATPASVWKTIRFSTTLPN